MYGKKRRQRIYPPMGDFSKPLMPSSHDGAFDQPFDTDYDGDGMDFGDSDFSEDGGDFGGDGGGE